MKEAGAGVGEERERHRQIIHEMRDEYWPLFLSSPEGVIIFLDEEHKVASERAASLFGYRQIDFDELLPFFNRIIAPESLLSFESDYYEKIIGDRIPTRLEVAALRRKGVGVEKFRARFVMVPISHWEEDLIFTLSFVREI